MQYKNGREHQFPVVFYFPATPAQPMKLKRLKLENFRAKETCTLEFGERLTLLIGINGSGKTTILDGIAIGLGPILTYLPNLSGRTLIKSVGIRVVAILHSIGTKKISDLRAYL